ncbi:MAG: hypothetical protein NZT92_02510 [Abditibacteriales bacterium]|nr:hypothetical protein [Abditibacteriales bacterium]MDW8366335.1 hypothetical protein [Abditibacteriales bacterium]
MRGSFFLGLVMGLGLLTGCGGGKGFVGGSDESRSMAFDAVKLARNKKNVPPPQISDISISPTTFDFFGGTLHVQTKAQAKKKKDVLTVTAVITRQSDARTFEATLTQRQKNTFAGDFTVPPNLTNNTQVYNVVIQATDGRPGVDRPSRASAGTFIVRGVQSPPGTP